MIFTNPILIAKIGAPHGIKGEVRVKPFTDDPLALGDYGKLHTKDGQALKVMRLRPQKTMLVVKFKGVNHRDEAEALNGLELYIDRSALPDDTEEDEFYVTDLINCDVLNETGQRVGKVLAVPNFGAGDLIEISPLLETGGFGTQSWFLEFTQENVPDIDLVQKTITIVVPDEVSERDEP